MNVIILATLCVVALAAPQQRPNSRPDYERRPINQVGSGIDCRYRCTLEHCETQNCRYRCRRPTACEQTPNKAIQYAAGLDSEVSTPAVSPVPADATLIAAKDPKPSAVEIPTAPIDAPEPVAPQRETLTLTPAAAAPEPLAPIEVAPVAPVEVPSILPEVSKVEEMMVSQPLAAASLVAEKPAMIETGTDASAPAADTLQAAVSYPQPVAVPAPQHIQQQAAEEYQASKHEDALVKEAPVHSATVEGKAVQSVLAKDATSTQATTVPAVEKAQLVAEPVQKQYAALLLKEADAQKEATQQKDQAKKETVSHKDSAKKESAAQKDPVKKEIAAAKDQVKKEAGTQKDQIKKESPFVGHLLKDAQTAGKVSHEQAARKQHNVSADPAAVKEKTFHQTPAAQPAQQTHNHPQSAEALKPLGV